MADEDPELDRLVKSLPGPASSDVDSSTSEVATTSPDDLVSVHLDRVTFEDPRPAGHIHVGHEFWKRLGLDDILKSLGFSAWLVKVTCMMTLNRLIHPAAEYAMPDWIRSTAMADILKFDSSRLPHDPLYRNLDRLHPHRATIESALAEREQTLFDLENTILLYDLTSTYFEGKANHIPKPARLLSGPPAGLQTSRRGFGHRSRRISSSDHEIFEGNIQDRMTLALMLELLEKTSGTSRRRNYRCRPRNGRSRETSRSCDSANCIISWPLPRKSETATSPNSRRAMDSKELIRQPSPRNPSQKKSSVRVKAHCANDETLILCISSERVEKDRAIRIKQEQRFLRDVAKVQARIQNGQLKKDVKIGEAIGH